MCSCEICYCGRPSAEEGAIGVVGLERDGGRIEREMASDGRVDWLSRATGRRNREDEGGASRLLEAEVAEAETLSAQVPGMSVDRSQSCWMVAQEHKIEEAGTTVPVLGGFLIGRGLRSVSRNCLRPWFGVQDVAEKLRRCLFV